MSQLRAVLILFVLGAIACTAGDSSELAFPRPAPLRTHKEEDDFVKPGRRVFLKVGLVEGRPNTMVVRNMDSFAWTLLDDVRLAVSAPNVQIRQDGPYIGNGRGVYLRCPVPFRIPAGDEIEISFQECFFTTYEPGPDAHVQNLYLAAREGFVATKIDPWVFEILRSGRRAPVSPR